MLRKAEILMLAGLFTAFAGCASSNRDDAMMAIACPDYLAEMVAQRYGESEAENFIVLFNGFKNWRKEEYYQIGADATDRVVAVSSMLRVLTDHGGEADAARALFIEVVGRGGFSGGYWYRAYSVVRNTKHDDWTPGGFRGASYDGVLVNDEAWEQAEKLASLIKDNEEGLDKWPQSPLIIHLWDGTRWRSSVHRDPVGDWMSDKGEFPDIHDDYELHDANRAWATWDTDEFDITTLYLYLYIISGEDKDTLFGSAPDAVAPRLTGVNEFIFGQMGRRFPGGIEKAMEFLDDYLPKTDIFGRDVPVRKVPEAAPNAEHPPNESEDADE